jgi:CysZ protein
MNNPVAGLTYFLKGLSIVFSPGIKRYLIIPLTINTLLFIAAIWLGFSYIGQWIDMLIPALPEWLAFLDWLISGLLYVLFGLICILLVFFTFSMLANVVAAPFNDLLCTAVAKKIGGENIFPNAEHQSFVQSIVPSVMHEIRKLGYFVAWSIPFVILLIIPGINIIGAVLWFLFTAWMLNYEYMEYPMSQANLDFQQQKAQLKSQKFLSLSFGSIISAATMIPFVNFLVMPVAVAGATALWIELSRRN